MPYAGVSFFTRRFWILAAILAVSGAISTVYMVRHKVWEVGERFGWKVAIISAVMLVVLAVVGFILAMTKTNTV